MENLESMTKPQLAAVYNELADKLGKPRTNRMESREAGIRRVRALLTELPHEPAKPRKPLPEGVKVGEPVNSQGNYYAADGTFMNKDGTRSVFDDVDDGPEFGDGCDHEGFKGGCERFGHTPGTCPDKPTHASAAADTWRDENVRAARAMRHRVEVGGVEYRSVSAAFKALRLPLAKHSPFRGALVKAGTLEFQGHTFKVLS